MKQIYELNKHQTQLYILILIAISSVVHILLGIYFVFIGMYLLAAISIFDIMVYLSAFFINKAGKTRISSFIIIFKVMSFSLMATFLFGTNVHAQWIILLVILPTSMHMDFTKMQRICIIAVIPFVVNLQLILPMIYPSPFNMDDNIFLGFFFANIIVAGFFTELIASAFLAFKTVDSHVKDIKNYKNMSYIDPLTKINNRRYADHFFDNLISSGQNISCLLCLIDVDNFKKVNDTYGHEIGDIVLTALVDIFQQNVRQTDLLCRWGGEEFLIGLTNCGTEDGREILEKIRKSIEDKVILSKVGEIKITITGGASLLTDGQIKAVLDDCDKKLYEGKKKGKNVIVI